MFCQIKPHPLLAHYVKSFWIFEQDVSQDAPYLYHSMADIMPEIIFQYKGRFYTHEADREQALPRGILFGHSNAFRQMSCGDEIGLIGIYLYPYALSTVLDIPAAHCCNQTIDLADLWGKELRDIEGQLYEADTITAKVDVLTTFLLYKIYGQRNADSTLTAVVKELIHLQGDRSVEKLAGDCHLSLRQFERKFKSLTGFAPKYFSRIIRFQAVLNEYGRQKNSLTELAYRMGYYDQAHFIREFKEFSGLHPRLYFSGNADGTALRATI